MLREREEKKEQLGFKNVFFESSERRVVRHAGIPSDSRRMIQKENEGVEQWDG